jgi:hypothetical protein
VGAFEVDLPSSIGAMQLSSASSEAQCAEEYIDSEGIIRRARHRILFLDAEQETPLGSAWLTSSPLGLLEIGWPQRIIPLGAPQEGIPVVKRKIRLT